MQAGTAGTPNPGLDFESQGPGVGRPGLRWDAQTAWSYCRGVGFRPWGVEGAPAEQLKTLSSHPESFGFNLSVRLERRSDTSILELPWGF